MPLQHYEIEGRRTFFDALKINQSLIEITWCGYNDAQLSAEEEEYFKECLLENGRIISMQVPWKIAELKSILERNARTAEEKRFKVTKLAAQ